jgi:hypothetical protein
MYMFGAPPKLHTDEMKVRRGEDRHKQKEMKIRKQEAKCIAARARTRLQAPLPRIKIMC